MKRARNLDGGRVRRLSLALEQPVGADSTIPLADLLDEATRECGAMGPGDAVETGEAVNPKKRRWLARWAIRVVCEAILRQGAAIPLPWAADLRGHDWPTTKQGVAVLDAYAGSLLVAHRREKPDDDPRDVINAAVCWLLSDLRGSEWSGDMIPRAKARRLKLERQEVAA